MTQKVIYPDGTTEEVSNNIAFGLIDSKRAKLYKGSNKMMSSNIEEIVPYKVEPKKKKGYRTK